MRFRLVPKLMTLNGRNAFIRSPPEKFELDTYYQPQNAVCKCVRVIVRAISFQNFQSMWS